MTLLFFILVSIFSSPVLLSSPAGAVCLVGGEIYNVGENIGYIGLECTSDSSFEALVSECGPNDAVIEVQAVVTCPHSVPYCVQCHAPGQGGALCRPSLERPDYCSQLSSVVQSSNNDLCIGSSRLTLGETVQDSTTSATFDDAGTCGTPNTAAGVWFSVIGTGTELMASTCSFASYDTKISVFNGTCEELQCISGNDDKGRKEDSGVNENSDGNVDLCGVGSEVVWESSLDETYYILVHGFGSDQGKFELTVDETVTTVDTVIASIESQSSAVTWAVSKNEWQPLFLLTLLPFLTIIPIANLL